VDGLYKKWQEVQGKKSNAVIPYIPTGAEFYAEHCLETNYIDSGTTLYK